MARNRVGWGADIAIAAGTLAYNVAVNHLIHEFAHIPSNLAAAGSLVAVARVAGVSPAELGLGRAELRSGVRTGVAASLPVVAGVAAAATLPATRAHFADVRIVDMSRSRAAYELLARIPIGTALGEELIFRGALLGLFTRRHSTAASVAASSALFGVWHVAPTLSTMRSNAVRHDEVSSTRLMLTVAGVVTVTAAAGAAFSWLRVRSGSVLAPALAHAALNASAFAAARRLSTTPSARV